MYGLFEDVECHRHYWGSIFSAQRIRKDFKGGYGNLVFYSALLFMWDRGSTVVKVLCYNSEGRWFDPS